MVSILSHHQIFRGWQLVKTYMLVHIILMLALTTICSRIMTVLWALFFIDEFNQYFFQCMIYLESNRTSKWDLKCDVRKFATFKMSSATVASACIRLSLIRFIPSCRLTLLGSIMSKSKRSLMTVFYICIWSWLLPIWYILFKPC